MQTAEQGIRRRTLCFWYGLAVLSRALTGALVFQAAAVANNGRFKSCLVCGALPGRAIRRSSAFAYLCVVPRNAARCPALHNPEPAQRGRLSLRTTAAKNFFGFAWLCPAAQSDGTEALCALHIWRVRGPARFDSAQSGSIQAAAPQLCHRKITCTGPPDGSDARNDPLRPSGCDRTVPLHDRGMHGSDGCNGSPWTGTPDTSRTCQACWSG